MEWFGSFVNTLALDTRDVANFLWGDSPTSPRGGSERRPSASERSSTPSPDPPVGEKAEKKRPTSVRKWKERQWLRPLRSMKDIEASYDSGRSSKRSISEREKEELQEHLYHAAEKGDTETLHAVFKIGGEVLDVNARRGKDPSCGGPTALFLAAFNGHGVAIKMLIQRGALVDLRVRWPEPTVFEQQRSSTSPRGAKYKTKRQREKEREREQWEENGYTALYAACAEGKLSATQALVEACADTTVRVEGATPFLAAVKKGRKDVVEYFISMEGSLAHIPHADGRTPLFIAAMSGHRDLVEIFLNQGADPNVTTDGLTPLFIATYRGYKGVVDLLLSSGKVDVNTKALDGTTPLFMAAHKGHKELVGLLLEKGADVTLTHLDGRTPLFVACQFGHIEVVKLLLEAGSDVNASTEDDGAGVTTPLYIAGIEGHTQIVRLLIETGKVDENIASEFEFELQEEEIERIEEAAKRSSNSSLSSDGFFISGPTNFKRLSRSNIFGTESDKSEMSLFIEQVEEARKRRVREFLKSEYTYKVLYDRALENAKTEVERERYKELYLRYRDVYVGILNNDKERLLHIPENVAQADADWAEDEGVKKAYCKAQELREAVMPLREIRGILAREQIPVLGTDKMQVLTMESKSLPELLKLFGDLETVEYHHALLEDAEKGNDAGLRDEIAKIDEKLLDIAQQQQQVVDCGAFCEEILKRATNSLKLERLLLGHGKLAIKYKDTLLVAIKKELEDEVPALMDRVREEAEEEKKEHEHEPHAQQQDRNRLGVRSWRGGDKRVLTKMAVRSSKQIVQTRDAFLRYLEEEKEKDSTVFEKGKEKGI